MNTDSPDREQALKNCITRTSVEGLPPPYRGKVRDVYGLDAQTLGIVVSDRISAFDHVMRQAIPFKGQILNRLAAFSFEQVDDLVETHLLDVPHPNVSLVRRCEPLSVEVVIRACLTGHAWRVYESGERTLCGVELPEGMRRNERFDRPILTPATKAEEGHDEDISEEEILERGLVDEKTWSEIREKAFQIFERGQQVAAERGLILVDTKYEFGLLEGNPVLIDEVHTADSSRYFYAEGYEERLEAGRPQKQLSKEFLREWLMERGFRGGEEDRLPDLPDDFRWDVYLRYRELYETLTGRTFESATVRKIDAELEEVFAEWRSG